MSSLKSLLARTTAVAVAAGTVGVGGVALSATSAQAASSSPYLFEARAYGTAISGGSLSASSGKSAYAYLGCTNRADVSDANNITGVDLEGLDVGAVSNNVRSTKYASGYVSYGRSAIASIKAGDSTGPNLEITALSAVSRSFRNSTGFHSALDYSGTLDFAPVAGGPKTRIAFPDEGETVALPGLGTVTGGVKNLTERATYASASGYALKLHLDASDSNVLIGRTSTLISNGTTAGVMGGRAYGSRATLASGAVTSGPTGLKILPCRGTGGVAKSTTTAATTLPGLVGVGATESTVRGSAADTGVADAWTRSTVARVDIGEGVVIRGIRASAHVHRYASGKVTRTARGTVPGTITVDGSTSDLPVDGRLVVPGVAEIDTREVTSTDNSLVSVAVRVTLLSGTGANSVVDLGNATASITRH